MKTVTICGSIRFSGEMQAAAFSLEARHGMNVLQCVYPVPGAVLSADDRAALAAAHLKKIDLSDGIYVLDINGYIGEAVRAEITYAEAMGKEVLYHSRFSANL